MKQDLMNMLQQVSDAALELKRRVDCMELSMEFIQDAYTESLRQSAELDSLVMQSEDPENAA